jgi:uncharacterized membrane protein
MAPPAPGTLRPERNIGIDLARGVAVVLMIQTHAFDGWVAAPAKAGPGYALSRMFANIPAPLFLLLSGIGLAFAFGAQQQRGTPPAAARAGLRRRALEVVGYGYLVSAVYSLLEGRLVWPALLRADILHCIGLSMLVCTALVVGRSRVYGRALGVAASALLAGIAVGRWVPTPRGWAAVPLALLFDVPPYTRFPLLPLCGFTAVGVAVGALLQQRPPRHADRLAALTALLVLLVPLWQHLTTLTVAAVGGRLSRSHPAVVWNFLDGSTRALAVLCASLAAAAWLASQQGEPPRPVGWLVRLGRGSLLAYAVHIPLCYGRLARPLSGRLQMPPATVLFVALVALTYGVVWGRDRLRAARRTQDLGAGVGLKKKQ